MFRVIRVLFLLTLLAGTFLLFDRNSESITIYFFRDNGYDIPGYLAFIGFIMVGVIIGYIISLKSVFSYRSEISKLVKSNKEITEELDSLRNVAVGEEFSFSDKEEFFGLYCFKQFANFHNIICFFSFNHFLFSK